MRAIPMIAFLSCTLLLPLALTGCASGPANGEARYVEEVVPGVVTEVLTVTPGTNAGATPPTLQITIRLNSDRMIAVTETTAEPFRTGDRVQVLSGNGITRVTH